RKARRNSLTSMTNEGLPRLCLQRLNFCRLAERVCAAVTLSITSCQLRGREWQSQSARKTKTSQKRTQKLHRSALISSFPSFPSVKWIHLSDQTSRISGYQRHHRLSQRWEMAAAMPSNGAGADDFRSD